MSKIKKAKNLLKTIEDCQFDKAYDFVTEDFTFNGVTPKPMLAEEWLRIHELLSKGFPDFNFHLTNLSESGNTVNGSVRVQGTHKNELPSIMPGQFSIPATNKNVQNPEENIVFTFKGDKIEKVTVERVPNGGVAGFLKQIGAKVPVQ